jgi:putative oxidoreductase
MDTVNAAMLVLRILLGVVFLAHGVKHLRGREKTTAWFESIGFKSPGLQWAASTLTELGVGVLLILGLLTGLAATGVIGVMTVAFWTVHRRAGFWITAFMQDGVDVEGYEYVMTLAGAALVLAIGGPGEWSIDWAIEFDGVPLAQLLDGRAGLLLAAGGIVASAAQIATFWRPESVR